ncbi:hypothetical protein BJ322DRAFT_1021655 [Thelephora terrestris]|uniref:Uncharacterized protein n=1 Tax=Thelephora terrestris TaxID=56493 RepID=A0A9P6HC21_9AGAM|nr:hypothetical protein BJ322DRAFT_1021655 [Thelephora terrestris]
MQSLRQQQFIEVVSHDPRHLTFLPTIFPNIFPHGFVPFQALPDEPNVTIEELINAIAEIYSPQQRQLVFDVVNSDPEGIITRLPLLLQAIRASNAAPDDNAGDEAVSALDDLESAAIILIRSQDPQEDAGPELADSFISGKGDHCGPSQTVFNTPLSTQGQQGGPNPGGEVCTGLVFGSRTIVGPIQHNVNVYVSNESVRAFFVTVGVVFLLYICHGGVGSIGNAWFTFKKKFVGGNN